MSTLVLTEQTTPATPTTGKVRFWAGADGILRSVDDAGIVTVYGITITSEDIQDAIGAIITDTASVDFTYNDAGNTITATVIAGGVDHDALLNFVANEHINHSSVSITAGTGLSGGGDITTNRTLNIANTAVSAGSYGSSSAVGSFTVNAQGQLTAASNVSVTPAAIGAQPVDGDLTGLSSLSGTGLVARTASDTYAVRTLTAGTGISVSNGDGVSGNPTVSSTITQYTDELAQDAVGGILTDTASVDFTYNDAGNQITAAVLPAGVDHNSLQNFVANKHIDHSTVSISAGTGLTGGGDISANRTISMPNVGTAGTYGSVTQIPVITTDAQGRVSSVSTASVTSSQWVASGGFLTWSNETGDNLRIRQAGNIGESAFIEQMTSRGTLASPLATLSGDRIGGNAYIGWNSGGEDSGYLSIEGYATENHTPSAQGSELRFYTTPNGTTSIALAMTIAQNGDLVIVDGLRLGNTTDTTNGNIRYNATEYQVREAGVWNVISNAVTYLSATGAITTTSATFATVGSMTTTPSAGTYKVDFTCAASIDADSNGDFGLFIAASEQASTRRSIGSVASGGTTSSVSGCIAISTVITVNGSQVVDIRYRENSGGTLTVNAREMILTPISR